MAMSQAILAAELKNMTLYGTEAAAVTAWANVFATYFEGDGLTQGAESNAIYITAAGVALGKSAMALALVGMSGSGNGAAKIAAGVAAFWNALVAAPATAWPTVTLIVPPAALAGLAAALQTTFNANRVGAKSKNDSMDAIAADLHTACTGPPPGQATWPGPVVMDIT